MLKKYCTQVFQMYNIQSHGLAVKNTGTISDKGGNGRSTE